MAVVLAPLQAGADPEPTTQGFTPLHGIVRNPKATVSVVCALLEAGADPMARDEDGDTPVHWAANWTEDVAMIEALLDVGADVSAQNNDGSRPVDLAWDIRGSAAYWRLVVPEAVLVPGRTINGRLSSYDAVWDDGSHYAVWAVTARAGQRVVIDMESDDVDAYLRVLRSDGTVIATDDDGGSGSNARVEFRVPNAGHCLVIATSYEVAGVGEYGVRESVSLPNEQSTQLRYPSRNRYPVRHGWPNVWRMRIATDHGSAGWRT